MKVLVIGGSGFVGKYVVEELLSVGHRVTNLDLVAHNVDNHNYTMLLGDAKHPFVVKSALFDTQIIINLAAKIGGIAYFHKYPADLLVENERILSTVFEASAEVYMNGQLEKIIQISSSMVYESTLEWPSFEGQEHEIPPPISVYGFQKLASEYYCQAFSEQYGLPYIIVRPFNIVGVGENPYGDAHVIPQLVLKVLEGQDPLEILGNGQQVRVFTHGYDLAKAVRLIVESSRINTSYNITNPRNAITMIDLAEMIWKKIRPEEEFRFELVPGYPQDVQKRVTTVSKAVLELEWSPSIALDIAVEEIIKDVRQWMTKKL